MNNSNTTVREQARTLETNKVLKNTYILLSMTLLFSATTAFVSYMMNIGIVNPFITFINFPSLIRELKKPISEFLRRFLALN